LAGDEVGILHGLAGSAFAEVVDRGNRDHQISRGIGGVGDEDQIRASGPLAVRGLLDDADEALAFAATLAPVADAAFVTAAAS